MIATVHNMFTKQIALFRITSSLEVEEEYKNEEFDDEDEEGKELDLIEEFHKENFEIIDEDEFDNMSIC
jgi:hypothetical protein